MFAISNEGNGQEQKQAGRGARSVNRDHTSAMKKSIRNVRVRHRHLSILTRIYIPMNNIEWIFLDLGWTLVDETRAHRKRLDVGVHFPFAVNDVQE